MNPLGEARVRNECAAEGHDAVEVVTMSGEVVARICINCGERLDGDAETERTEP